MSEINNEKVLDFFHEIGKNNPALSQELYRRWEAYKYVKPTQRQPLFRTHDGVDIYEGDKYWYVNSAWHIGMIHNYETENKDERNYREYFSNIGAANEYKLMNKPCLSVNDIVNCYYSESDRKKQILAHADHFYINDLKVNNPLIKRIIDEAKQKINQ